MNTFQFLLFMNIWRVSYIDHDPPFLNIVLKIYTLRVNAFKKKGREGRRKAARQGGREEGKGEEGRDQTERKGEQEHLNSRGDSSFHSM